VLRWLLRTRKRIPSASDPGFPSGTRVEHPAGALPGRLDSALQDHRAGRLSEARSGYREVLAADPGNIDALHFLGVVAYQQKDYEQAARLISKALSLNSSNAPAHNNLGNVLQAQGRFKEALASFLRALALAPDYVDAYINMGAAFRTHGNLDRAIACYRQALALVPGASAALIGLEIALEERSKIEATPTGGAKRFSEDKRPVDELIDRGAAFLAQGEPDKAVESYQMALSLEPGLPDAHFGIGNAYKDKARLEDAATCYERALSQAPDFPAAYVNLGNVLNTLGRPDEAIACFRKALALEPDLAEALYNFANVLQEQGRLDEAILRYEKLLVLHPELPDVHCSLGHVFRNQGRRDDALACYRRALAADPNYVEARWALAMSQIPRMYVSIEEQQSCRTSFSEQLDELERWFDLNEASEGSGAVGSQQPFSLAYQEENNRDLLQRYGRLCTRVMNRWYSRQDFAPAGKRDPDGVIRVGVISQYFWNHSVWKAIVKGWFQHIDRERFALYGFCLGTHQDQETAVARSGAAHFEYGRRDLRAWVESIAAQRLDVLVYPEIGMDPAAVRLASLRLAPVQVATWGHPETTGLPTIDYYFSAEDLEPAGAQDNYTERLVTLPHLGCFYQRWENEVQEPDFDELGIDPQSPLILCAGMPFKYAPQYDWIFPEFARRLGRCQLVFFEIEPADLSEILRRRLEVAFAKSRLNFGEFVRFIPWQSGPAFDGLLTRADVFLDTIGFSGFNTAMQAIERGLPIVSREGRFLRGRLASGPLKRMGLHELVAESEEEYIAIGVRLIQDGEYRDQIRRRIRETRHVLFEDIAPIRAMENFMAAAVARIRHTRN
jgi:predicted O-linked N-acetylglucosamine transferase (SPINDLY family)